MNLEVFETEGNKVWPGNRLPAFQRVPLRAALPGPQAVGGPDKLDVWLRLLQRPQVAAPTTLWAGL